MPGVTDEKIVKEIQKGRVEIFEEIINRYEKKLMRYILRMIYSKMDAEDILQDVFVKTYKEHTIV